METGTTSVDVDMSLFEPIVLEDLGKRQRQNGNVKTKEEAQRQKKMPISIEEQQRRLDAQIHEGWLQVTSGPYRIHREGEKVTNLDVDMLRRELGIKSILVPLSKAELRKLEKERQPAPKKNDDGCCWMPFRQTKANILT